MRQPGNALNDMNYLVVDDDSTLLKLIAEKISEEDDKVAVENGLITQLTPCSSKTKLK